MSEDTQQPAGLGVSDWLAKKAADSELVPDVLPSGLAIKRYQSVSMERLVFAGKIPVGLLVNEAGQLADEIEIDVEKVLADMNAYIEVIDAVFMAAIAEPVIGDVTDPEAQPPRLALSLFEDYVQDKIYIMGKVLGGVAAVRQFHTESDPG